MKKLFLLANAVQKENVVVQCQDNVEQIIGQVIFNRIAGIFVSVNVYLSWRIH